MFGAPLWLIELIIAVLRAVGAINLATSLSLKLIIYLETKIKKVKSYHDNCDFPYPSAGKTNESNINRG